MAGTAEGARIRVLLVDDHGVVRRGLRGYLELLEDIEVIGEAENGLRGVELCVVFWFVVVFVLVVCLFVPPCVLPTRTRLVTLSIPSLEETELGNAQAIGTFRMS